MSVVELGGFRHEHDLEEDAYVVDHEERTYGDDGRLLAAHLIAHGASG
jgi:hypothetical protein